jgi:hypothetical protein
MLHMAIAEAKLFGTDGIAGHTSGTPPLGYNCGWEAKGFGSFDYCSSSYGTVTINQCQDPNLADDGHFCREGRRISWESAVFGF